MKTALPVALLLVIWLCPNASKAQAVQTTIRGVWYAPGNGPGASNTFYILTPGGAVIIDTSGKSLAATHKTWIQAIPGYVAPSYVILTHGHGDHTAGVAQWQATGNPIVIAQSKQQDLLDYLYRLTGFFNYRNAADGAHPPQKIAKPYPGDFGATPFATITFDQTYIFTLGGLTFQLFSAPGETEDMLNVWIPELRTYFIGDNWYSSFPNLGSPRGTRARWALEYVSSLNIALGYNALMLLPSHGAPISGQPNVANTLANYRDAIQNVHDQVLQCLNAQVGIPNGCQNSNGPPTIEWLMQNIHAPAYFTLGESYGRVAWGVRAIAQDYIGWFLIPDGSTCAGCVGDAEDLFPSSGDNSASSLNAVLGTGKNDGFITSAMAVSAVSQGQSVLMAIGSPVKAARLADLALRNNSTDVTALNLKYCALSVLYTASSNFTERNWLQYDITAVKTSLGTTTPSCSFVPGFQAPVFAASGSP
jgi:glyoxylase-like metal-dependent hydrolase (beta-lactamase superfamily II)